MIIQENLKEICKGRTVLIIAHRLSTINNADSVEYTAFITIGYEMNDENTTDFKIQLFDHDNLRQAIEGVSYNINIEWDINGVTRTKTITGRLLYPIALANPQAYVIACFSSLLAPLF